MAGYEGNNGSTTSGPSNAINSVAFSNVQGATAQSWAGVTMDENNSSLGNSNDTTPFVAGSEAPGYAGGSNGQPVQPAVAQPGGANVLLVPGGQFNADNNVQLIGSPAGTAGGGLGAPYAGGNPMLAPGWTAQSNLPYNEDSQTELSVSVNGLTSGSHTAAGSTSTPTTTGGTSPYTYSVIQVDGLDTSTLPSSGWSFASATGVLSWAATNTNAGTFTFTIRVTDSSSPKLEGVFTVEVVLS